MSESLLKKVYLFRDMNSDQLSMIHNISKIETYGPGDELFVQGDKAISMFIIQFGSVKIYQNTEEGDRVDIATLGTGSHFGEMSFLDGEPRSANVNVLEKTDILVIDYDKLDGILHEHPAMSILFYRALSIFLCSRLRQTTTDLKFARELNLRHF
tara:strand:- start:6502 stop:6966 length:465 start_codon:yes stop_codon:yes gene_type:complete